jgi:hypothetical protein
MMSEAARRDVSFTELSIEMSGDRTVIKVIALFSVLVVIQCCVLLTGTTTLVVVFAFVSLARLAAGDLIDALGSGLCLLILAAVWFAAARALAWCLYGHEVILVENGEITYSRFVARREKSIIYSAGRISDMRWVDLNLQWWYRWWYDASYPDSLLLKLKPDSCVEFRYGAELICIAVGTSKEVGEQIVAALLKRIGQRAGHRYDG